MKLAKTLLTLGSMIGAQKAVRAMRGWDVDDILGVVGLERRDHYNWGERVLPSIGLIVVSAAVGAGAALLFAPEPGADLRRRISSRANDAKHRLTEKVDEYQRKLEEKAITS